MVKIHLVALGPRYRHPICSGYSGLSAGSGQVLRSCSLRTGLMRWCQMCHKYPFLTYQKHRILLYISQFCLIQKIKFKKAVSPRCLVHWIKSGDSRTGFCRYKHSAKLSQRCDKYGHGTRSVIRNSRKVRNCHMLFISMSKQAVSIHRGFSHVHTSPPLLVSRYLKSFVYYTCLRDSSKWQCDFIQFVVNLFCLIKHVMF